MKHIKILDGLDNLCWTQNLEFKVIVVKQKEQWVVQLQAGEVSAVQCLLESFVKSPQILLEPFVEELIKRYK